MARSDGARGDRARLLAWVRVARVFGRVDRATAALMRRWDLSVAQFDALTQVGLREGLTQQELADRLLVTKGNVSQLLARMERRGLVRRTQEGRAMALTLTEAGWALYREVVPAQEALVAACFEALSPTEARALAAALRRVERAMGGE